MTTDITGCKRRCEIMNRPAYIVLFKGDDSDFQGNQSVNIVIDTELDTTGMKAHFRFMDFVQDFDSIPENKTLSLVFPNAKTSEFPLGAADATLRFEDASGKFRTVSNRIHIVVTNSVHEAYDNEDSQSITVTVKGTVTWEMIEGKPPIPEPITIDTALSTTSENPVQNKVVSKALYTGFTEWEFSGVPSGWSVTSFSYDDVEWWIELSKTGEEPIYTSKVGAQDDINVTLSIEIDGVDYQITATRHLVTPTKTSQLTNDGAPDGGGTPYATTAQVAAKQDALSAAQLANIAAVPNKANTSDVNAALAQKASLTDLPYRLVTPGKWEFSGSGYDPDSVYAVTIDYAGEEFGYTYNLLKNGDPIDAVLYQESGDLASVFFYAAEVTATKTGIHLLDRAGNLVVVSGDTTLTLPALTEQGKLRDFLVRLEISSSTVPTITFQGQGSEAPNGADEITYETDGDEFPVPDEAGDWLYSFTESCVAHKFAVSLKKVNTVAQGGS